MRFALPSPRGLPLKLASRLDSRRELPSGVRDIAPKINFPSDLEVEGMGEHSAIADLLLQC